MTVPFLFTGNILTMVLNGESRSITKDDPRFTRVRDLLSCGTEDEILEVLNSGCENDNHLSDVTKGRVRIEGGVVYYRDDNGKDVVVDNKGLVERILDLQRQGLPFDGMACFIERLYGNVSSRTRRELLDFIERNGLTIDSEGYILAYKAVRSDYMDKYSGTIDNSPGRVISMDRSKVDDDFTRGCSSGLHAGALEYVHSYGHGNDRIVIVRIDPADVVSVPSDCSHQKLRTCRYQVVADYNGELEKVCYDSDNLDNLYDDSDYEEDFDWDDLCDETDDDCFEEGDVVSECSGRCSCNQEYGVKPNGHKYYNRRDSNGRFVK